MVTFSSRFDRLAAERADFAFETTCSGLTYVRRIQAWKQAGYRIEMVYLRLRSIQLAVQRIYRPLADRWPVYDNSGRAPRLLEKNL